MIPSTRPRIDRAEALRRLKTAHGYIPQAGEVLVIGLRGYYANTTADNKRGIYDDALLIIGPDHFSTYNGNTDPSAYREGIAKLKSGISLYKPGIHGLSRPAAQQYAAFVQAGLAVVYRDKTETFKAGTTHPKYGYCLGEGYWRGYFGINIHRGGKNGTSSLGCQTIPPAQWTAYHATLTDQLRRAGQKQFKYCLI